MSDPVDDAIAALEGYLRRYPSGHFTELAQVRLDRLLAQRGEKRVVPVAPPSPFTKGAILADTNHRVGERHEVRITDVQTGIAHTESRIVTAVTDLQVIYNNGQLILDPLGNPIQQADGKRYVDSQHYPAEYFLGKKWSTRYKFTMASGFEDFVSLDYAVTGTESVTVPAGTFDTFRIEGNGWAGRGGRRQFRYWVAPTRVRRFVLQEQRWWDQRNAPLRNQRTELISFSEARAPA